MKNHKWHTEENNQRSQCTWSNSQFKFCLNNKTEWNKSFEYVNALHAKWNITDCNQELKYIQRNTFKIRYYHCCILQWSLCYILHLDFVICVECLFSRPTHWKWGNTSLIFKSSWYIKASFIVNTLLCMCTLQRVQ
jgi:hypothetical protein